MVIEQLTENLEVCGFVHPCILTCFLQVREGTPLSCLVANKRLANCIQTGAEVISGFGCLAPPFVQSPHTSLHVVFILWLPSPAASHAGSCVYSSVIMFLPVVHKSAYPRNPVPCWFVACRQHAERGMISISFHHPLGLFHQVGIYHLSCPKSYPMIGPRGTFRLQIESQLIRCHESRFRGAVGMKTHVVESISFTLAKDALPTLHVHRWITSQREVAVFHCAAKHCSSAVDAEHVFIRTELTHAKLGGECIRSPMGR